MKKTITLGLMLLGITLMTGCTQPQTATNPQPAPDSSNLVPTTQSPPPTIIPGKTTETATGKRYTNTKYNFTIDLPKNYFVTGEGSSVWAEGTADYSYTIDLSEYRVAPATEYAGIRLNISPFSGDITQYVNERLSNYEAESFGAGPTDPKIQIVTTTVGEIPAYRVGKVTYLTKNGQLYSIGNSGDAEMFKQIIATFKFLP